MKELLLELFSMVLEAPKVQTPKPSGQTSDSVSPEDQQAGTVLPTRGGRWRAKQVGTNKILYWGDQEIAVAWAKGQRSDDGGEKDDSSTKPTSIEEPVKTYTPPTGEKEIPEGPTVKKTPPIVKVKDLDQSIDSIKSFNKSAQFAMDGVSDEEFESNERVEYAEETIEPEKLSTFFVDKKGNTLFPKKYIKVLSRLLSTQPGSLTISDFTNASGAGTLASTTGELLTLMGMSIRDERTAEEFFSLVEQHVKKNQKLKQSIIDVNWVRSAKKVRGALIKRYDSTFGTDNWNVSGLAWDVRDEVEALGLPDYKNNKGFSTDIYIKINANESHILDEISLKKDLTANLLNATSGRVADIMVRGSASDEDRILYDDLNTKLEALANNKTAAVKRERTELIKQRDALIEKYNVEVPEDVRVERVQLRQKKLYEMYVNDKGGFSELTTFLSNWNSLGKKRQLEVAQSITKSMNQKDSYTPEILKKITDLSKKKFSNNEEFTTAMQGVVGGAQDRQSKFLLSMMYGVQHVEKRSDRSQTFSEAIIQNSHNHSKAVRKFLLTNPQARKGLLLSIRDAFPLKSLFEGEETMVLGDVVADKNVLHTLFGTENFDELEQKLTVRDEPPPPSIVYRVIGQEDIPIAEISSRPDGIGYGTAWKLEMSVHKEFGQRLKQSNEQTYGN